MKAEDFFKGLFETDLRPGELIVAVKFPVMQTGTAIGFAELSRRHGDFALVGLAAVATMQRDRIGDARLVVFRLRGSREARSIGVGRGCRACDATAECSRLRQRPSGQDLAPEDTPGLRADTKLHMATVLTRRVLNSLSARAAA